MRYHGRMDKSYAETRLEEAAEHMTAFVRAFSAATMGKARPDVDNEAVRAIFRRLEHMSKCDC